MIGDENFKLFRSGTSVNELKELISWQDNEGTQMVSSLNVHLLSIFMLSLMFVNITLNSSDILRA